MRSFLLLCLSISIFGISEAIAQDAPAPPPTGQQVVANTSTSAPTPTPTFPLPSAPKPATTKRKEERKASSRKIRYSYSGADCKAVIYFDDSLDFGNYGDNGKITPLEGLATISYSIYEAKSPVRRLGERSVTGYTKGIRTIAGSMVFLVVEDHPFASILKEENKTYAWSSDNNSKGKSFRAKGGYVSSMLRPFNIGLFYKTEVAFDDKEGHVTGYSHGNNVGAHLVISGVEIVSEGMVTSVNDMVTEVTMQFVAHDVFNIEQADLSVSHTKAENPEKLS
jgi:hypothetical protein